MALYALKVVICGACFFYIFSRLGHISWADLQLDQWFSESKFLIAFISALLLFPLNWYLEVLKWQRCVRPLRSISRSTAAAGVLRGLALNWIMPFTLGDFMGRMLGIPRSIESIKVLMVSRIYAMGVTAMVGIVATVYLYASNYTWVLLPLAVIVYAAWRHLTSNSQLYDGQDHFWIAVLTIGRYMIFSFQLIVLLSAVLPDVDLLVIGSGVGVVFLLRSIVPSLLGALGVREAAIVFVFSAFIADATPLLVASFSLWFINIILPSIMGLVPLLAYRFKLSI